MARSPKRRGTRRSPASQRNKSIPASTVPRAQRAEHPGPRFAGATGLAQRAAGAQWLSLAALYVASLVVYGLLAHQQSVPWLFPDEFIYGNVAQNIAHGAGANWRGEGQGVPLLYPVLLSFPFRIGSAVDGYGWAKLLGVALSSAVVVPVWLLARELVGHRLALVAAALSVAGAWMSYSSLLVSENLALPLAVAALARDGDGPAPPGRPLDLGGGGVRRGGGLHARDPLRVGAGDLRRAAAGRLAPARRRAPGPGRCPSRAARALRPRGARRPDRLLRRDDDRPLPAALARRHVAGRGDLALRQALRLARGDGGRAPARGGRSGSRCAARTGATPTAARSSPSSPRRW